ncbi:hypothetical protein EU537_08465 [Candidatus Thorarchaeota archaeon]|nr:MAG: hypothetical protein EU537_08465 [Candidatus Thorarchaeota archaeon]
MVTGYEVSEDGTLNEVQISDEDLSSAKVVCVVDDETKSIYLWKGRQAGIRKKFIGARVATNLRSEYGFHFKVRPLDEGEEPPTFFTALDGTTAATKVITPGQEEAPPTPTPNTTSKPAPPPTPPKKTETPEPGTSKAPAPPPTTPKPAQTSAKPEAKPARTVTKSEAPSDKIQNMIAQLQDEEPPDGYQRELLIVYNELFSVAEHKISVFGQEKVERKFEKVKDPPEGTFMAEGFIPRVIVRDGQILGIELLKGTPDAILSPIKSEMKERLTDLITFFKSEVDEGVPEGAPDKKKEKKRKLVAK